MSLSFRIGLKLGDRQSTEVDDLVSHAVRAMKILILMGDDDAGRSFRVG